MTWHMITASELNDTPVYERLFAFAGAYRNASFLVSSQMASDPKAFGWSDAAVALMLAAHAVELFLKAALLKRFPDIDIARYGHRLDDLNKAYRIWFKDPDFDWDIPFTGGKYPDEMTQEEIIALRKNTPDPSIRYRYPISKGGDEWSGLEGFEARSFLLLLDQLEKDFHRIRSQLQ